MKIIENKNLKNYNTFGIKANAERFIEIESKEDIVKYFNEINQGRRYFILGGGSNILLVNDIKYDVLHIGIKGKEVIDENSKAVTIKVNAGENWHEFVKYTVENKFSGVENLALIPGNVGTAPIQNIGAYGVEQNSRFVELEGYDIESGSFKTFNNADCNFDYRDSIFKNKLKGKFIVTSVTYKLSKKFYPNLSYSEVKDYLKKNELSTTQENIFKSVVNIRQRKLPEPSVLGNSGSFFKNPIVNSKVYKKLNEKFPELKGFKTGKNQYKLSAGWMIEKTGMKGVKKGDAGVYDKHALILVNHGNSSGKEVWSLAKNIQNKVSDMFGVKLEPEVNVVK